MEEWDRGAWTQSNMMKVRQFFQVFLLGCHLQDHGLAFDEFHSAGFWFAGHADATGVVGEEVESDRARVAVAAMDGPSHLVGCERLRAGCPGHGGVGILTDV